MPDFSAAVVGGGLAGCTAAWELARQGVSVVLLEKNREVGRPIKCAEFIPKMMLRELDLDTISLVQPIERMRSVLPSGKVRETASPGYIINKDQYTQSILKAAVSHGAEVMTSTKVTKVTKVTKKYLKNYYYS